METYLMAPEAELDYGFDWTDWLATGETIITSTWTVPSGLTERSRDTNGYWTKIWLYARTSATFAVTNAIVTSAGRADKRTLTIKVTNR